MEQSNRDLTIRCLQVLSCGLMLLHLILALLCGSDRQLLLLRLANIACLLTQVVALWLLYKEYYRATMLLIYLSELIHIGLCARLVGYSAGFQIPLLGLTALAFLSEYQGRALQLKYVPALPLGIGAFAVFALLCLPHAYEPGTIEVPRELITRVQAIWSLLVFALIIAGMVATLRLATDSERVLTDKAQTDRLTGLYNRAGYDQLRAKVERECTTLLLVDVDKFKGVNDTYGHETGDRVLKKIAKALERNFRLSDCVCRIGGDEFAILMLNNETMEEEQIAAKVGRINRELAHTVDDKLPLVSVSVGVAHGSAAEDWTELFNNADAELYKVKQAGGRGCSFSHP